MPENWQSPPYQSLMRRLFQSDPESDTFFGADPGNLTIARSTDSRVTLPELARRSCSKARFRRGFHKHGAQLAQQDLRPLSQARCAVDFEEWVLGANYSRGVQL